MKITIADSWEKEQLKAILQHWGLPETLVKDDGTDNDFSVSMSIDFCCGDERRGQVTVFTDEGEYDIPVEKLLPFAKGVSKKPPFKDAKPEIKDGKIIGWSKVKAA